MRKRAVSMQELYSTKFSGIDLGEEWRACIGSPEPKGWWTMHGPSFNGKTSSALSLAKALCSAGMRGCYDSFEEGKTLSMQIACMRSGMDEVSRNFLLLHREPIIELIDRLQKRNSPDYVVLDSIQYSRMTYDDCISLEEQFPNKLFIAISHAENNGKDPKGRVAQDLRYHASVKLRVEGFKVFPESRYGGGKPITIYAEGANAYWGEIK